jgi:hypothetical protein
LNTQREHIALQWFLDQTEAVKQVVTGEAIPIVVVRRGTRPDIPDAIGKNLEGDFWVIVFT